MTLDILVLDIFVLSAFWFSTFWYRSDAPYGTVRVIVCYHTVHRRTIPYEPTYDTVRATVQYRTAPPRGKEAAAAASFPLRECLGWRELRPRLSLTWDCLSLYTDWHSTKGRGKTLWQVHWDVCRPGLVPPWVYIYTEDNWDLAWCFDSGHPWTKQGKAPVFRIASLRYLTYSQCRLRSFT